MCSAMSHKPDPQPSQPPAVRAEVARMQAGAARLPPSPASSVTSADVSSPSSPESPETVRREGPGATGRQRGEGAVVGKGVGGDKRGQAEAGRGRAEEVAAEAEGQGEGQGQRAAEGPGADPCNVVDVRVGMDMRRREWRSQRESVVADILEVSKDEGEGAGRMAVEGGPGRPSALNGPAAAMKSILPEVRRQEEGKGGRGQLEAGAAGSGDSSVSAGGRGRTGKGGKGQAGTSGAVHAKGHLAGKGEKGSGRGRQWPQPQRSFRQSPPRSPPRVSAAVRAEEEREVRRQQAARYQALAHVEHQRRRRQPPEQEPDTIYQLEMERGGRGWGGAAGAEQRSGAGQWCGTGRMRQGQAGERSEATWATGEGTGEGGTPRSRQQGTRGDGATRQGAGEGEWPWVHGLAGVPREGIGIVGRCSPASSPTNRPTIPAAAIPGNGDGVPAPAGVPGHAATGAHAAAPAGRWDSVGGARREWRRAQEGVGDVGGGREEPAGEGGQGQG